MKLVWLVAVFAALAAGSDSDWIAKAGGSATRDQAGRITRVDLRSSWVTDADLAQLAAMPALQSLDLSLTRITDHGLQQLKGAPGIVDLNLYYAELITDEGVAAIKDWKHLRRINLRGTKITDTTFEHLAGIATLESIDAGFVQVTDVGPDRLTALPHLKELTLGGNKLTDVGLQPLRHLAELTHLDISGIQRTDSGLWSVALSERGLDTIATLKNLRELRLGGMALTGPSLEKLKGLTKLERISLQGCKRVGDDAAPVLGSFSSLHAVDLKGTAFTEKGVEVLKRLHPGVEVFFGPLQKMPGPVAE